MSDATTTVTSNGSYVVGIDNNNDETDRWWAVQKDGATELMRLTEGGLLGLGTNAPGVQLEIVTEGADCNVRAKAYGTGFVPALRLLGARGTAASPTATQAGDIIGAIFFQGFDTANSNGAQIRAVAAANWGTSGDATDDPTDLVFATVPDGEGTLTDRMVITAAGNVGIGQPAPTELFVVGPGVDASAVSQTLAMVTAAGAVNLAVRDSSNDVEAMVYADSGGVHLGAYSNHPLFLAVNNTTGLYIGTDGKIGLGTTAPGGKLHIGDGFDTPALSSPSLYISELGATKIAVRDSTNNIEAGIVVGTTLAQLGTITNHDLALLANNAEAARIKADGKTGIGTTAPASILHAAQSNNGADTLLTIENSYAASGSTDEGAGLAFLHNGFTGAKMISGKEGDFTVSGNATGNLQFVVRNAGAYYERMRIAGDGDVGIGTVNPTQRLAVEQESASAAIQVASYGSSVESALRLYSPRGTQASPTATQSGDNLGAVYFEGFDTDKSPGAKIYAQATAAWGSGADSTDSPAELHFATVPDGSGTLTDRLILKSDGRACFGSYLSPNTIYQLGDVDPYIGNLGGTDVYYPNFKDAQNQHVTALFIEAGEAGIAIANTADELNFGIIVSDTDVKLIGMPAPNIVMQTFDLPIATFGIVALDVADAGLYAHGRIIISPDLDTGGMFWPSGGLWLDAGLIIRDPAKSIQWTNDSGSGKGYLFSSAAVSAPDEAFKVYAWETGDEPPGRAVAHFRQNGIGVTFSSVDTPPARGAAYHDPTARRLGGRGWKPYCYRRFHGHQQR